MVARVLNWSWNLAFVGFVISGLLGLLVLLVMLWIPSPGMGDSLEERQSTASGGSVKTKEAVTMTEPGRDRGLDNPDVQVSNPWMDSTGIRSAIALAYIRLGHLDLAIKQLQSITSIEEQADVAYRTISELIKTRAAQPTPTEISAEEKAQLATYLNGLRNRIAAESQSLKSFQQLFRQANVTIQLVAVCEDLKIEGAVEFLSVAAQLLEREIAAKVAEDAAEQVAYKKAEATRQQAAVREEADRQASSERPGPKTNAIRDFLTGILGSAFVTGILTGFAKPLVDGWSKRAAARLGASCPSGPPKEPAIRVILEKIIASAETTAAKSDEE